MDKKDREYCGGKMCLSYREARIIIGAAKRRNKYNHSKEIPKREYHCPVCGTYHLTHTSKIDRKKRKIKEHFDE